jgi:hypothetical protein
MFLKIVTSSCILLSSNQLLISKQTSSFGDRPFTLRTTTFCTKLIVVPERVIFKVLKI